MVELVLEDMEALFTERNKSLSGLIDALQESGVIAKKGRRKKRSQDATVPTGGGGG